MSFQAYLDNIKAKTGKTPEDFRKLAEKKGLLKPGFKAGPIVSWLKEDFGLGHGHAMAIYGVFTDIKAPGKNPEEEIEKHFTGAKSVWRKSLYNLMQTLKSLGHNIEIVATNTYLSILKDKKKFAVIYITTDRMDIGIKRKGVPTTVRFEPAGTWNAMVTHRVCIHDPKEIDKEVIEWLKEAYAVA